MNYKINWYRYFGFVLLSFILRLLFDVDENIISTLAISIAFVLLSIERTNY